MPLVLLGLVIGWVGLILLYPGLQPLEGSPGLLAVATVFGAIAWAALWISFTAMFDTHKKGGLTSAFRLGIGVGYALVVVFLARFFVFFPAPWKVGTLVSVYGGLTAVFAIGWILTYAVGQKEAEVERRENAERQPIIELRVAGSRLESLVADHAPAYSLEVVKINESLRFTSPVSDPDAQVLEAQILDKLTYLEQLFRFAPEGRPMEKEAQDCLAEVQRLVLQRSRLVTRSR